MLKIKYLAHFPSYTKELSEIWCETIGKQFFPEVSSEMIEQDLRKSLNESALPIAYVALDENDPVGMCILSDSDDVENSTLSPWLCDLCLKNSYRKRGLGKLLVNTVKSKAFKLGYKKLHLITFDKALVSWYETLGWSKIDTGKIGDRNGDIMAIDLTYRDVI